MQRTRYTCNIHWVGFIEYLSNRSIIILNWHVLPVSSFTSNFNNVGSEKRAEWSSKNDALEYIPVLLHSTFKAEVLNKDLSHYTRWLKKRPVSLPQKTSKIVASQGLNYYLNYYYYYYYYLFFCYDILFPRSQKL